MNTSIIEGLEDQLAQAKGLIERRDMAMKLAKNHEFRKLILEDFCVTEAARLVHMSADPAMDAQQRVDALAMAQATGHLKRYLSMMVQMASVAERDMLALEEALAEARLEEGEDADEYQSGDGDDN